MRKLGMLMMIPALVMLLVPAMASANWYYWWARSLDGTYEMVANGSCLHSPAGFDLSDGVYTPKGAPVWAATTFAEATWTFEPNGTGTVSGWNYVIDFPPGRPIGTPPAQTPDVRKNPISFAFHYELTASGEITATFDDPYNPPALPHMYGKVSIDRRVITLVNAYEPQTIGGAICNVGRTLFRVSE